LTERSKLLWLGKPPTAADRAEAKNRGLEIEEVLPGTSPDYVFARGIVFWATPPHFEATADALEASLPVAIDHGLYLHIVVSSEAQRSDIAAVLAAALPNGGAEEHYRLRIEPVQPHEGPQAALMHNPGPPARSDLSISVDDFELTGDRLLLLQRAFCDCHSIALQRISGGLSGAQTFLVDAKLRASNAGLRPSSFFVKMDAPVKLREEMKRFREFAEHHIDWNLRPNFAIERSIYGVQQGVLVGAFVRDSRSLWEVILDGDGPTHIRSLFQDTLGGLRQEPERPLAEARGSVVEPLDKFCKRDRVPSARVEAARALGGVVHPPRSLWRKLLDLSDQLWRRSATHGDMHGENVRTRKGDAIVIDFAQACTGPMSSDVASLEVWLAFKVAPGVTLSQEEWRQRTEALYAPCAIERSLAGVPLAVDDDPIAACVDELRRVANESVHSPDEYKRVLAVYLMRQATFPADAECAAEDEFRRTYAYWLANQLVLTLCAAQEPQLETA